MFKFYAIKLSDKHKYCTILYIRQERQYYLSIFFYISHTAELNLQLSNLLDFICLQTKTVKSGLQFLIQHTVKHPLTFHQSNYDSLSIAIEISFIPKGLGVCKN